MATDTRSRPLHAPYRVILEQLAAAESGLLRHQIVGSVDAKIENMVALGYIATRRSGIGPRNRYLYLISDLGREVLESGVVAAVRRGRRAGSAFNTSLSPVPRSTPAAPAGCVHYWLIESVLGHPGTCQRCGQRKEFRPTFGGELSPVGKGQVTASERFAARAG